MAKRSKKRSRQTRNFLSGMMLFIPALLAAATAFFNAMSINSKGGMRALIDDFANLGGDSGGDSKPSKSGSRKRK
jgi:hypothetical protein